MNELFRNKIVMTYNIDKGGNDIITSIRLLNRDSGNSMKYTYPIASVGGPVMESYENEKETIFNDKYPIRRTLQSWVYDSSFMLTIIVNSKRKQCQSIMVNPVPMKGICAERSFDAILKLSLIGGNWDWVKESNIMFDDDTTSNGGPPELAVPVDEESISFKFVTSDDSETTVVGVQFIVREEVKLSLRFRYPLHLTKEVRVDDIKLSFQQVMGIPTHDGKQQNIAGGLMSNSAKYPCACCTCPKNHFNVMSERLWKRMQELYSFFVDDNGNRIPCCLPCGFECDNVEFFGVDCPHGDFDLRVGEKSTPVCAMRFNKETREGTMLPTEKLRTELNERCVSVHKTPLLHEPPCKQSGEPMHESSGYINHFFDKIRNIIRELEEEQPFMNRMRQIHEEVGNLCDSLALTTPKRRKDDPEYNNLIAKLHVQSNTFRKNIRKVMKDIQHLSDKKEKSSEGNEDESDSDSEEEESTVAHIDEQITALREKAEDIWNECQNHAETTKYSHFVDLQIGNASFYKALTTFLQNKSKRPRGRLEFAFNNAIDVIGGGGYNAEHGGFEQTNGRAINSLENFSDIADVCEATYDETNGINGIHIKVKALFAKFRVLAKALYSLAVLMKSQKKIDPDYFDIKVIDVMLAWNETFPGVPYFNKLHFVMVHLPEFVRLYHICGRASGESHESVHCKMNQRKKAMIRMCSTKRMHMTLYARSTSNLKPGIPEREAAVDAKQTGKKRGRYKYLTRRQDNVDIVGTMFKDKETVENEDFLPLVGGGRIHSKYKDEFLIVKAAKVPDEWVAGFVKSNLLSATKIEQATFTTY
ncbi:hypothetical protein ACHAXR_006865 [Thalassiosira sp. AJA248-18]